MAMARLFLMFVVLSLIFVAFGWVLGLYLFGDPLWGMVIFLVLAGAMNAIAYFASDRLVLASYGARIVERHENPRLHSIVERVALKADLPKPRVAVVPTRTPNAFATGRDPEHAVVAATEGILTMLDDDELEGVMAHEMAHVKNRDILVMSVVATVAGAIAFAARWALWSAMFNRNSNGLVLLLAAITAPIAAILVKSAISRSREYKADATGAKMVGKPWALASALQKLERGVHRYPLRGGNPASSHLFIVNPFRGGLASLFSSHPPTEERVRRLRSMV